MSVNVIVIVSRWEFDPLTEVSEKAGQIWPSVRINSTNILISKYQVNREFHTKHSTSCLAYSNLILFFNGMLTCLGLFYASRLRNCVHCTSIFTFLCHCFFKRPYQIRIITKHIYLTHRWWGSRAGECGVHPHCHYSQLHSDPEC